MKKLIMSGSQDFDDVPIRLIDVHSRGVDSDWMRKRAAVLSDEIQSIRPEPNRTFLHLIAMGATEAYGPNRNADGFRKQALIDRHGTFVSNGHVYKNHVNKDPKKASGIVKCSAYNEPMSRVELVIGVDNDKWSGELQKLANGEDISYSMACTVPFDVCNICENEAKHRGEYCDHMKKMAGRILDDGKQVYVDNPNPTFFDISGVFRPADRIAYNLQKVASAAAITGAELADMEGLYDPSLLVKSSTIPSSYVWDKLNMLRKLAKIEKTIDLTAPAEMNALAAACAPEVATPNVCDDDISTLSEATQGRMQDLMSSLGKVQISLPLKDFIRIVMGNDAPVSPATVEKKLPGVFSRILEEDADSCCRDSTYDIDLSGTCGISSGIEGIIDKMIPGLSLASEPVKRRSTLVVMRKIPTPELIRTPRICTIKSASEDAAAELLAREYAKYKVALLTKIAERVNSDVPLRLGVLQNYVAHES